jgi:phage-related protein
VANEDVVWVDVLPSLQSFTSNLKKGLSAALGTARSSGSEAGQAYGEGFAGRAEAALSAAQSKVQAVTKRLADAQGTLTVAQTRLAEAQAKGTTSATQLAAAHEAVQKAERNVELQTGNLTRAQAAQKSAVDLVASANRSAKDAQDSHTASIQASNKETEKAPGLIEKFSTGWIKTAAVLGTVTYAAYGIKTAFGALFSTIDVASSLNEEVNKSRVVFGDASQSVIDFAANAAKGMGESRLEALQSTGIFGNLFRAVGLTTDQSAVMSTQLVKLASDLASFNNADPSEVLLAMRAGLVGESEPMRRFGVDLSDLALRQEAMNLGIYDGTGVLNQAQKAQAAYSLLLKQTTLAQGDFVRTSAGLANSTRILKAEWTDLQGALGGLLLGPATGVVHWLNDLLPRMQSGIEGLHKFGQAFADGFSQADGAARSTGVAGVFEAIGQQARNTFDWVKSLTDQIAGAFRAGLHDAGPELAGLGGAFSNLIPVLSNVVSAWHGLITGVVQAFLPVIRDLIPVIAQLATSFATILNSALQNILPVLSVVAHALGQVAQVVADVLVKVLGQVSEILPGLTEAFSDVATTLGRGLLSVVQTLAPALATLAQTFGGVVQILAGAFLDVVKALEPVLPVLAKALSDIASALAGALADAVKAISPVLPVLAKAFADIATAVGGALAQAVQTLAPLLPPLVEAFVRLFQAALQPLLPILPVIAKIFTDIVGALAPLVPAAAGVVGAFAQLATNVLPALAPVLGAVATTVRILAQAFEALPGPLQALVAGFVILKATLGVNIFEKAASFLSGWVGVVRSSTGAVSGAFSGMTGAVKGELATLGGAFTAAKVAQQELVASNFGLGTQAIPRAVGDLKGLEAAAGHVASQGFGAMKGAASGLVGFLGGPWGLAIAGATLGLALIIEKVQRHNEEVQKATQDVTDWYKAMAEGGPKAVQAQENLRKKQEELAQAERDLADLQAHHIQDTGRAAGATTDYSTKTQDLKDKIADLKGELDRGSKAYQDYYNSLTPNQKRTEDLTQAQNDLDLAFEKYGANSPQVAAASEAVRQAQEKLNQTERDQKSAVEGATGAFRDYVTAQLGAANASLGLQSGLLSASGAIDQYNKGVADGTLKGNERAQAENSLSQSIVSTVEAAGRAAAQALGPSASAADQSIASAHAQRAAFETLVGQLGFIPPSLQGVADSLGITSQSMDGVRTNGIDPLDQKFYDLAQGTLQGTVADTFRNVLPDAIGTTDESLNRQAALGGPIDQNSQAWKDYLKSLSGWGTTYDAETGQWIGATSTGLQTQAAPGGPLDQNSAAWQTYLKSLSGWGTSYDAETGQWIGAVDSALNNQAGTGGTLARNQQAWHDYVAGIAADIGGLFGFGGGAGALPGAVAHANADLQGQAAPGGPIWGNENAWHGATDNIGGYSSGLWGSGGTVPSALDNTNTWLGKQATQDLPASQKSWHDYVSGLTADILGLFGFKGGSGALPGALANGSVQLDAFQTHATGQLDIVNADFTTTASTAQTQMGLIEAHIAGPMTTSLINFSTTATTHTGIINAAFTTMQQTSSARMVDVENHIYGPMTAALVAFSTNSANTRDSIDNSYTVMRDVTSGRMVDVENHIYGPMTNSLVTLANNSWNMSGQVQNSFWAMSNGAINASNVAASGINAAWDRIKAGVAGPVNFVIVNAIGGALIPAFNNVAAAVGIAGIGVGLPSVKLAEGGQVPGLADGGQIGGAYIGPKVDNVPGIIQFGNGGAAPVRLNPREYVQPVSSVNQYGVGFMEAVRTGAFPTAIARAFADGGLIPGLATGGMTYPALEAWVRANLPGAVITSAYRPGANDYHGAGDAVDISYPGNPQSLNMPAAAKIAASFGGITELIHNPNESIKNGQVVPPSFWGAATWAEHANHVHWAMTPQALTGGGAIVGGGGPPVGIMVNGQLMTSSGQVGSYLTSAVDGALGQLPGRYGNTQLTRYLTDFTHSLTNRVFGHVQGRIDSAIAATAALSGGTGTGPVADQVRSVFDLRGWGSGAQWAATDYIVSHESGWNPGAQNPVSSASGLFQEIDGTWAAYRRRSAAGFPHMRNAPVIEQAWAGLNYIAARYGSPAAAQAFWAGHHYYDDGGILGHGMTGSNASGFDERVLSPRQTVAFERLVNVLDRGHGAAVGGPVHMTGDLYLDSGEFMGHVQGTVTALLDRQDRIDALSVRSA